MLEYLNKEIHFSFEHAFIRRAKLKLLLSFIWNLNQNVHLGEKPFYYKGNDNHDLTTNKHAEACALKGDDLTGTMTSLDLLYVYRTLGLFRMERFLVFVKRRGRTTLRLLLNSPKQPNVDW